MGVWRFLNDMPLAKRQFQSATLRFRSQQELAGKSYKSSSYEGTMG